MTRASKKSNRVYRKNNKTKNNKNKKTQKRSKTMKKEKKGEKIGDNKKVRQVYCLKCKCKVDVDDYIIKKTPKGVFQVQGICSNHANEEKPVRVFGFIKSSDV
jgi:hypothetical protein